MQKDFQNWHNTKSKIHSNFTRPFFHEREVWWCSLGVNVGGEQDGTGKNFDRPVVLIKGFNKNLVFAVALTGKKKEGKYYFYLGQIAGREATAVLSQVRLIDTKRLIRKVITLELSVFKELKNALEQALFG